MSKTIPLKNFTHLRFQGPDAERYLNGQVTQQVSNLPLGSSRHAFVCDGKGRILFDCFIHADRGGFLVSVEKEFGEEAYARLDRYLIADDCELSDETEKWCLLHELGESSEGEDGMVNRFGKLGRDLYLPAEQVEEFNKIEFYLPSHEEQENLRLKNGIPRSSDFAGALPAETRWEDIAVSFHKGCYLGQEVISRMKRAAKTNRRLVPVILSKGTLTCPLSFTESDGSKSLLKVTSVATEGTPEGYPALGYLSSRYQEGTSLLSEEGVSATISD